MSDTQLHEDVGVIKGTVNVMREIQIDQTKDIKKLVSNQNKQNVKIAGVSGVFGAIGGFLTTMFKHL